MVTTRPRERGEGVWNENNKMTKRPRDVLLVQGESRGHHETTIPRERGGGVWSENNKMVYELFSWYKENILVTMRPVEPQEEVGGENNK